MLLDYNLLRELNVLKREYMAELETVCDPEEQFRLRSMVREIEDCLRLHLADSDHRAEKPFRSKSNLVA